MLNNSSLLVRRLRRQIATSPVLTRQLPFGASCESRSFSAFKIPPSWFTVNPNALANWINISAKHVMIIIYALDVPFTAIKVTKSEKLKRLWSWKTLKRRRRSWGTLHHVSAAMKTLSFLHSWHCKSSSCSSSLHVSVVMSKKLLLWTFNFYTTTMLWE